jgi:cell division protein FtsB
MPFVVLVLGVLGGGLVGLLLLNSAAAADSFAQDRLQRDTAELTVREQELSREVAAMEAPGALASQARRLGLVPSGEPGFLIVGADGSTRAVGTASPATTPPPPPPPSPTASQTTATATANGHGQPSPAAGAGPTASPSPAGGPVPTPTAGPAPAPTPGPHR